MNFTPDLKQNIVLVDFSDDKIRTRKINQCNIKEINEISKIYKKDDILYLIEIELIDNPIQEEKLTIKRIIISKKYGIIGAYSTLENKIFKATGTIFSFENIL